jgi:hypothetical protein
MHQGTFGDSNLVAQQPRQKKWGLHVCPTRNKHVEKQRQYCNQLLQWNNENKKQKKEKWS